MLDTSFILANQDIVREAIKNKGVSIDFDRFLQVDKEYRALLTETETVRAERNALAKQGKQSDPAQITQAKELKQRLQDLEAKLKELTLERDEMLWRMPNIPWEGAPIGPDASSNKVIKQVGTPKTFSFEAKDHISLGLALDILDLEKGAQVAGFRGYYLKNEAVLLQQAILLLGLQEMQKAGFTLMTPPTAIKGFALYGSGHFPFGKNEIFSLQSPGSETPADDREALYLAGTSEPALLSYYANETIPEAQLPKLLCGISQCYREEIGSYGKDTKGLYRVREFVKVEQVVLCKPEAAEAEKWFTTMLDISQKMLEHLDLPYQLIETSTGDMGAGKRRMVDIETWMPGRQGYGETHSSSNLSDWQARRLNIKTKGEGEGSERQFVYTLNNTVIASPRILIALLENHQQKDGSVKIPKALQKIVGLKELRPRA